MNSFSFKPTSVSLELEEKSNQGSWNFQREFVKVEGRPEFISDRMINTHYNGIYYYWQDALEKELAKSVVIPSEKCEELRKFVLSALRPEKKEISLQDLANKFVLDNYCASTFDVMKEKILQHKIPESQIETMRNLYELESITKARDIGKFKTNLADELHITQQTIDANKHKVYNVLLQKTAITPEELDKEIGHLFTRDSIAKILTSHYEGFSHSRIAIVLPGLPSVILRCHSTLPFLSSWNVSYSYPFQTVPSGNIETFSTSLSRKIFELISAALPTYSRSLMNPEETVWEDSFWKRVPEFKAAVEKLANAETTSKKVQ